MVTRYDALLMAACAAAAAYFVVPAAVIGALGHVVLKGACVGGLALWATLNARSAAGWQIAAVLALGVLGDVLLEAVGLTVGAVAFLAGHCVAAALYLRHRRASPLLAAVVMLGIAAVAWSLPADRAAAPGIAFYAAGLGAMTGTAMVSRYPRAVGAGAVLFALSDLLIFAKMGPLAGSPLPGALVWPLYFIGQLMIAIGVVRSEARSAR